MDMGSLVSNRGVFTLRFCKELLIIEKSTYSTKQDTNLTPIELNISVITIMINGSKPD